MKRLPGIVSGSLGYRLLPGARPSRFGYSRPVSFRAVRRHRVFQARFLEANHQRYVHEELKQVDRSLDTSPVANSSDAIATSDLAKDPLAGVFPAPISLPRISRYLGLKTFSETEIEEIFDRIAASKDRNTGENLEIISKDEMQSFLLARILELEDESKETSPYTPEAEFMRTKYAEAEVERMWYFLFPRGARGETTTDKTTVDKHEFSRVLREKASRIDYVRSLPIISSMLIVGASVGVVTPAMPFVVESLGLSSSQYGLVVSAFALSKMASNIPSAIFVERHGRKTYMVNSLLVIALGVGGIGIATSFEELYVCRLLTGAGVSFLSGAATMMLTDMVRIFLYSSKS